MTKSAGNSSFQTFQVRVRIWMRRVWAEDFDKIANNKRERQFRFAEESLELVQSLGFSREDVNIIADYVYGRPCGDPAQEVGGVMVTLAALCNAIGVDMNLAASTELDRINTPEMIEKIRRKHETGESSTPRGWPEAKHYIPSQFDSVVVASKADAGENRWCVVADWNPELRSYITRDRIYCRPAPVQP